MIETGRRKILSLVNSRYLYGKVVGGLFPRLMISPSSPQAYRSLAAPSPSSFGSNPTDIRRLEQPLLHAIVLLIEMVVISRLATKFNSYYDDRPGEPV